MHQDYKLFHMDCKDIPQEWIKGCSLLYVDPPFGPKSEDTYFGVGKNLDEYMGWLMERIIAVTKNLQNFNLVVHLDYKCGHYVKVELDRLFGRENFKNEIVWCYSGPSVCKHTLPRKHDVLYWYGIGEYVFNEFRVPYTNKLSVGGKTAWTKEKKDTKEYYEKGKLIEDWWTDIPPLVRNEKEKRGYKTQKPIKLLNRIVSMLSNKGGLVFDPMVGSGTTLFAALANEREFVGCDTSKEALDIIEKELKGA